MPRDEATLLDIVKAARLVLAFVGDMTHAEFLHDLKTQSAVQRQLLVIGEAVKRFSRDIREEHSTIPWSLIAGMRDHLTHAYGCRASSFRASSLLCQPDSQVLPSQVGYAVHSPRRF